MKGVGPPASYVSASRSLFLPEASDFENSTTWYDTIFSNYTAVVEEMVINPAAVLKHVPQESSVSSVTLICYFLQYTVVLARLRVQQ